jgi:protein TonB
MILRFTTSALLALGITFGLFYFMQILITKGSGKADEAGKRSVIEFVRLKRDSDTQIRKRKLPKKEQPEKPPEPPKMTMAQPKGPADNAMAIAAPSVDIGLDMGGGINLGNAPSDTDVVPLVRVPPIYPVRAAERGIEGYVTLRFSISALGTVIDPMVIDAKPARVFDRAAIRALKKWKYKPKVEDGEAVVRTGIEVKLLFELDT